MPHIERLIAASFSLLVDPCEYKTLMPLMSATGCQDSVRKVWPSIKKLLKPTGQEAARRTFNLGENAVIPGGQEAIKKGGKPVKIS
jgi:hypothetical protein